MRKNMSKVRHLPIKGSMSIPLTQFLFLGKRAITDPTPENQALKHLENDPENHLQPSPSDNRILRSAFQIHHDWHQSLSHSSISRMLPAVPPDEVASSPLSPYGLREPWDLDLKGFSLIMKGTC